MSWSTFQQACNIELGKGINNRMQFVQKFALEYHNCILRHVDVVSGGVVVNATPAPLIQLMNVITLQNENSPPSTAGPTANILQQMQNIIPAYWPGVTIVGPLGVSVVASPGTWMPMPLPANLDFNVMLSSIIQLSILHMQTMFGTFTSNTTGITIPWSGAALLAPG